MKSEQFMLGYLLLAAVAASSLMPGCARDELRNPAILVAPYDASRGEPLWGVAPLRNETGDPTIETGPIAEAFVQTAGAVEGLGTVPLARTVAAMNQLGLRAVTNPAEAEAVASLMGVDGLLIGSLTAYDPYEPPTMGLNLALHMRDGRALSGIDISRLRGSPAGSGGPGFSGSSRPATTLVYVARGRNHALQKELRRFAEGRDDGSSALGWRRYLASMELFTEFAAHAAVSRLLDEERLRLVGRVSGSQQNRP